MKRLIIIYAALLLCASAIAQSGEMPLKGDVNEDGKVDVADINAVIKIMKDGGGTAEAPTYYWYVGGTQPTALPTNDSELATGTNSGWRKIGTSKPSAGTVLFDGMSSIIISSSKVPYYFAINSDVNIGIYDSLGNEDTQFVTGPTVSNGMNIYTTTFNAKSFNNVIKVK